MYESELVSISCGKDTIPLIEKNGPMFQYEKKHTVCTYYVAKFGQLPPLKARYGIFLEVNDDNDLVYCDTLQDYCTKCFVVDKLKCDYTKTVRTRTHLYRLHSCGHINYGKIKVDLAKYYFIKERIIEAKNDRAKYGKMITKHNLRQFFEDIELESLPVVDMEEFNKIIDDIKDDETSEVIDAKIIAPLIATIDTIIDMQNNKHPFEYLKDVPGRKNIAKEFLTILELSKKPHLTYKMVTDNLRIYGTDKINRKVVHKFIADRDCVELSNYLNK